MFAGHAAVAMLAKGVRRKIPIALLVVVAFAPDVVQRVCDTFGRHNRVLSHSMVSVGVGATLVALAYWLYSGSSADAVALWLTYAAHWPADYITGVKPTWPGGPTVGLVWYVHPVRDALLESDIVLICWMGYWQSLTDTQRNRAINLWAPWLLIAVQLGFDFGLTRGLSGL